MNSVALSAFTSLFNTISSYLIASYFFSAFAPKRNGGKVATILALLVFFASQMIFGINAINLFVLILCTFVFSYGYSLKFYNKVLLSIMIITLSSLAEVIVSILSKSLFGPMWTSGILNTMGAVFSKLIAMLLCVLVGAFKNKTLIGKFRKKWLSLYLLPISTATVCYCLNMVSFHFKPGDTFEAFSVVGLTLLVMSNMLIFSIVNSMHESVVNENKLSVANELIKRQEAQYDLLFSGNEEIKKLRHDHKNFIIGLLTMLSKGGGQNTDAVIARLEEELRHLEEISSYAICGNSVIDTVINYKRNEASEKKIEIAVEYRNVHDTDISGIDLSILLGNALDNAIEAASEVYDRERKINISLIGKGNQFVISISNPTYENKDITNLKTSKGNMHGYGIVNMQKIAEKYNGEVIFSCEDEVFTTTVVLTNERKKQ